MSRIPIRLRDARVRARFWDKVARGDAGACWLWTAGVDSSGYGVFHIDGRSYGAHRISYMLTHGPLTRAQCVLHACDNRRCVNPAHLSAGSVAANNADARRKGRATPPPRMPGERHPRARLTRDDVARLRALYAAGARATTLAAMYAVSVGHVRKIARGERWRAAMTRGV